MKWHIAISPDGVSFRIEPEQELPEGWVRISFYPYRAGGRTYFKSDGSLKKKYLRLPIYSAE